jgi:hypothetical protein
METQLINKAVKDLLDKLVHDLIGYRWDSLCAFSDGQSMTVIELNIWRKDGQESAGRISYQLETGDVLRYHYPPIGGNAPEPIIDFLLDLYNLEKRISEAALSC